MKVLADNLGKKFVREWIFRKLDLQLNSAERLAILGSNGSGKSTLLQVLSGYQIQTEGIINYTVQGKLLTQDELFRHISIATPYMELVEELSLPELIQFQGSFKPFLPGIEIHEIPALLQLEKTANKEIRFFSSGMKQRVKLGLAILSDTSLLLLDEPCSNLDRIGIAWYHSMIKLYGKDRTIIVCSNHQIDEYEFCEKHLVVEDYKNSKLAV